MADGILPKRSIHGTPEYEHRRAWDRAYQVRRRAGWTDEQKEAERTRGRLRRQQGDAHFRKRSYLAGLKHRLGLTPQAYSDLLVAQDGLCAICYEEPATEIDHNHDTGQVRGALCDRCNRGLGFFKDDSERLVAASAYLGGE